MKKIAFLFFLTLATSSCCHKKNSCDANSTNEQSTTVITKPILKLTSRLMTPEVLWYLGRVGNVKLSPNSKQIAYTVTWFSIEENRSNTDIYIMDSDGKNQKQLTKTAQSEGALQWRPDGQFLAFKREGQLFEIAPDGTHERQLTEFSTDISEFKYAPTGDQMLFTINTKVATEIANNPSSDIYPDLSKSTAHIAADLMYRHWDSWEDGKYSHIYVAPYQDGKLIKKATDIMPNEPYDSPLNPFGGIDDITFSPDGKTIAYTCKKLQGKAYALTTNSNIYLYSLESKKTNLLTKGMMGYDFHPQYSPDGTRLMWLSMEREGYEADKERILIYDFKTEKITDVSNGFDASPSSIQWAADGNSLYLTACVDQTFRLFHLSLTHSVVDPQTKLNHYPISQLSKDAFVDYQNVQLLQEGGFIVNCTDMLHPTEIYKLSATGEPTQLSFINKDIFDQLDLPTMEQKRVQTTDNQQMLVWSILPPNMDKTKKHPSILMCTGGPQGPISQSYSFRWNFALMASKGYVVIYPARRGVSGSGQKWSDAVSKDHGGQPERDLLSAADFFAKEPYVDATKMGAAGASYGGFSIYWLAGNHNKRFKAFISHCGIFDFQSMYSTTEEVFFENWEMGGPFWDQHNAVAQRSFKQSPINFIDKWDTPILVIHGEQDYRVPYTQGLMAYNIAQLKGIPSRLVIFPDENHWVTKPQNAIVWQREFFNWFDTYLH